MLGTAARRRTGVISSSSLPQSSPRVAQNPTLNPLETSYPYGPVDPSAARILASREKLFSFSRPAAPTMEDRTALER